MKKILISIIGIIATLTMASCVKENTEIRQERDVFYTVSDGFNGTTAHTSTETEFDALLDRFCNYALNGEQVTFYSSHTATQAKGNSNDTPTAISTTDRDKLKAWMKEMEKAGKTVQITFDDGTGTWHGRAYANLGQDNLQEARTYSGSLVFVEPPALEEPPLNGVVWAMQVDADSTLIITLHGMMMWNDSISDDMRMIEGATMIFDGVAGTHTDMHGNPFMTLSLVIEEE